MRSRPATKLLPLRHGWSAILRWLACGLLYGLACWLGPLTLAHGQGTAEDYERAERLEQRTRNKVFREQVQPNWLPGNARFWYQVSTGPQQHEFVLVDAERGVRQLAFDHERLAAALAQASGRPARGDRLPLSRLEPAADGGAVRFDAWGRRWELALASYELQALDKPADSTTARGSAELPALSAFDAPRPSGNGGDETWVRFANQSDRPVRLFWIDGQGERKEYATLGPREQHRQHTYAGHVWLVLSADGTRGTYFEAAATESTANVDAGLLKRLPDRREARPRTGAVSPGSRYRAFVRDDNVWVRDQMDDQEFPLTQDGTPADSYQARFLWSPDSSRLLTLRTRPAETRTVHLIESDPGDQLQPRLHSLPYAKPGDPIDQSRPVVFDLASRQQITISDGLFANPWSVTRLRWQDDSASFDFLYNQRGHQVVRLVRVDVPSGQSRAVIEERSETFVDYAHKQFLHYVAGTNEIVWMSERDGWNHLYLVDGATGEVRQQITSGPWVVRGVERVDDQRRQIWFTAGGLDPREDPYHVHLCRVNFDGTGLVRLTAGDGTHRWSFSPDERFLLDTWSRVDQPPVTELRRVSDGSLVCELERADWTALLATGWRPPQRFVATGRDGQTKIYGILIRPSNFDPDRKYPVIEKIYAGPQSAYVPKAFGRHVREHALAELGFIVVQIDGMGTSHRSKAFHDVCWKNLGDSGFPDRIAWLRAAAAEHRELDLQRVGIFGGSAGGQNALRALLAHGDFYHVAVADCGCHDNRMDKIWWNELWMGWPVGPHYEQQSNVTQAHRLTGKLLLIVGEMDRNVDPASTLQVASRLIKAGKDFDLLLMPGVGHGAAETPYGNRRRMDFLVRHLWQVEPRRNAQDASP